ncbi:MAG: RIP metalloprotease RseP [Chloroflexota bacterium]
MLTTIVSFIIVLGILVFFHELGHYWVARRNGIVVDEFGLGYPPRMVKLFTYDGTDFTLNWIPVGGFARMRGEDAGDMSQGSFNAASRGARAATLFAGPGVNLLLAVFLFAASFMAGFPAMVGFPQIIEMDSTSIAAQAGVQPGDIVLQYGQQSANVSAIPNVSYNVMSNRSSLPISTESQLGSQSDSGLGDLSSSIVVLRENEILSLQVASSDMLDVNAVDSLFDSVSYIPVISTQIGRVAEKSPAEMSGILAGDLVYAVNDTTVTLETPLNEVIGRNLGKEVTLHVWRNISLNPAADDTNTSQGPQLVTINVTPRENPPAGEGALGVQIGPVTQLATMPFLQSMWEGLLSTGEYVLLVLRFPVMILQGELSASEAELTGPVGIAQMIGGAVSATIDTGLWFPIWRLAAVLSAALAVTNLLPLPALDGGRLLFILVETLRGRRVNPEREGIIHMVGFMLLLGLLVVITFRDITTTRQGIDWLSILGQ